MAQKYRTPSRPRTERREAGCPVIPTPQRPDPEHWPDDHATFSWLGHATVLANFYGAWILTDPALETRIGLGRGRAKLGPRRLVAPALGPTELPAIDLLLLSHAHMDHTDLGTLRTLPRDVQVVVQPGNRDLVRRFRRVEELGWGDRLTVDGTEIESVEVRPLGGADDYRSSPGLWRILTAASGPDHLLRGRHGIHPGVRLAGAAGAGGSGNPANRGLRPLDRQPRVAGRGVAHGTPDGGGSSPARPPLHLPVESRADARAHGAVAPRRWCRARARRRDRGRTDLDDAGAVRASRERSRGAG